MRTWLAVLIGLISAVSGVVLLAWLLWRLWIGDKEVAPTAIEIKVLQAPPAVEPEEEAGEEAAESAATRAPSLAAEADDLTAIEGIGPKISRVLREGGIMTFVQLAGTDPDGIRAILEAADPRLGRLANPGTWPDQAALAAEGKWEALADLQSTLKGGRKA